MYNPYMPRFLKRFAVFLGCFFGCLILASILDSLFLLVLSIFTVVIVPVYFKMKDTKEKNACIEMIRRERNQNSTYTVLAYHNDLEFGYLSLTDKSLTFVPKKGEIIDIPLETVTNYGFKGVGTGLYDTRTTNIGNTGMQISSTQEVKAPVFYVTVGEETYEWLVHKHSKMFDAIQKSEGKDRSKLKSNY
ncbi:hypothetical protein IEE_02223 [Bacillus cereus BAG5X1-1]|uniref:Uncharacterized protein n=1 Tax=Bacillus cereus BAG5X1-1 TaxID=1053189 RepID=J8B281_BACCE|nr:hypothetical protein [Bacillus cereus]EJQ45845.1 hypothetical protein IEE_02223 [Bacillus cereus BAG5X1-1]PGY07293.1 hypothetical protein COE23_28155 [Bacillus cereus]